MERGRRGGKDGCSSLLQGFSVLPPSQHRAAFPLPCPVVLAAPSFQRNPAPRSRMLSPSEDTARALALPIHGFSPPAAQTSSHVPPKAPFSSSSQARCEDPGNRLGNNPGTNHAVPAGPQGPRHPLVKRGAERSPRGPCPPAAPAEAPTSPPASPAPPCLPRGSGDGSDPKILRGNVCGARPREGASLSCLINRED